MFEASIAQSVSVSQWLDKKSLLKIIIKEATFLKDSDMFGKQDPYIKFKYNNLELQTTVKDEAGKKAKWDETFMLPNVYTNVKNRQTLQFEAFDKDIASSDFLGTTRQIGLEEWCADDQLQSHQVDLYDVKGKKVGNIIITS